MDETTIRHELVLLRDAVSEARSMMQYCIRRKQALADIREQADRLGRAADVERIVDLARSCADYNLSWDDEDYTDLLRRIARRIAEAEDKVAIKKRYTEQDLNIMLRRRQEDGLETTKY